MEAYLDNSATTRCYKEVKDIVVKTMLEDYGNPSAMHLKGVEAEAYVKQAVKEIVQDLKGTGKRSISFTRGTGYTESDNWAIIGTALANNRQGRHIITTPFGKSAVSASAGMASEAGL